MATSSLNAATLDSARLMAMFFRTSIAVIAAVLLLAAAIVAVVLLAFCFFKTGPLDYAALGELLLVSVLAIEGLFVIWEFTLSDRSTQASRRALAIQLHEFYLSSDFYVNVRGPSFK